MKNTVGVYVLSYKRKDYLIQMIDSLLNQSFEKFDLIISENSGTAEIADYLLQKYASKIQVIRRNLAPLDHINTVIHEGSTHYRYFCVLHDDDTVHTDYIKTCIEQLEINSQISSVSTNSQIIDALGNDKNKLLNPNLKTDQLIKTKSELIIGYINRHRGITGFPTYFYNSSKIKNHTLDSRNGGKHSDATFLLDLLSEGPILQIAKPFYNYRIHGSNDSATIGLKDTFKMTWYFFKSNPTLALPLALFFAKNLIKKVQQIFLN